MMANVKPDRKRKPPPLRQTVLIVILILAMGLYAANSPHSFLGKLLRFTLAL